MKKSLIALALLATAGVASAQSSVTLFGIVDATLAFGKGDTSDKTQLTNSGYNSSRLGFRGTEDLGGGMSASFWLEAGLANDDGQGAATNSNNQLSGTGPAVAGRQGLTFNRRSTVSLAGGWGEVRLGRDYTPQFWNLTVFDPFGTNGVGTTVTMVTSLAAGTNDPVATRASNSIGYFLPGNLGGFYGQLQGYLGENNRDGSATEDDGMGFGARLGWASGPFNVAGAYAKTNFAVGDFTTANIGGQWDFGFAKVMGQYVDNKLKGTAVNVHAKGWLLGGLIPVGAGEIRLSYSAYDFDLPGSPEVQKYALGYVHNLSKRTAVYATYAHLNNDGTAAFGLNGAVTPAGSSSSGFDLGIRHSF
jgi:predicted porin